MFKYIFIILILTACGIDSQESNLDLINGTPANIPQIVRVINVNAGAACTATIVGKRVILTAGHCASTGQTMRFNGVTARMTRSPIFPAQDHDISLGVVAADLPVNPATISTARVNVGQQVILTGFGCTRPGGGGGNDGILRIGRSQIIGFRGFNFVTRNGAALCFGDSGGPAILNGRVVGVNSQGNIQTTSFLTRLDTQASRDFIKAFERQNSVDILGL